VCVCNQWEVLSDSETPNAAASEANMPGIAASDRAKVAPRLKMEVLLP